MEMKKRAYPFWYALFFASCGTGIAGGRASPPGNNGQTSDKNAQASKTYTHAMLSGGTARPSTNATRGCANLGTPSCCRRNRLLALGLFAVVLVGYGQFLAAMSAAGCQYAATILCSHSLTEAVFVHSSPVMRLKCSFHCLIVVLLFVFTLWAAKLLISFEITKNSTRFGQNI